MTPEEEVALLRRTHDALPSTIITLSGEGVVLNVNGTAREMVPSIKPGMHFRSAIEEMTHVEKVDRLLIRRELTTFAVSPEGPELHWIVWDNDNPEGEIVLTVWDTDWSEVMNERRAAFTMAVSHELRGPLTAIRGFAEILNMDPGNLTPQQAEAAEIIETTARHLTVLVEDVFDLSRNSFGELTLHMEEVDIEETLGSVIAISRPRIEEREQTVTWQVEPGLPTIWGDEARTTQIISNLINNASIHNPEGTTIDVSARVEGDYILLSVEDDGDGLPFEDPEEAFHTFTRGATATAGDRTGSGIGLSIAKRLIQLHRGEIEVESRPGEGTCFTLMFPLDYDSALTPGTPGPV